MNLGVSVIICCHNSSKRLPETLRHLAAQQFSTPLAWEVLVIDNASTDDTVAVVSDIWNSTNAGALRIISEPKLGLRHARIRGITEARHEIISFLDDDNWAPPDWVERISTLFSSHSAVGAVGPRIEPVFEMSPPAWFQSIQGYYAVGSQHSQSGDITDAHGTLLFGAGLSLRATAVRELLDHGFDFLMSGREGASLLAGEDTELCFALRALGWRFWYDDSLKLGHFIPKGRLTWDYARRLMHGMGKASVFIELYLFALGNPPFDTRPKWKKTWFFQYVKTWKELGKTFLFHFRDCTSGREGSPAVLKYESLTGRLVMLGTLRGRYQKTADTIAQSNWAQAGMTRRRE